VTRYYFQGVPNWYWHYLYHYAPFVDPHQLGQHRHATGWEIGWPFTPLTQLMAVLPRRLWHCLPEAYTRLITKPTSRILNFYPKDFVSYYYN
jgi:5'-3' exonuclease